MTNTVGSIVDAAIAASATGTEREQEQEQERDEKDESSTSTGSDGGKENSSGSGSGGGYNGDDSSSDSSSNNDAATRTPEKQMAKLNIINNSGIAQAQAQAAAAGEDNGVGGSQSAASNKRVNNSTSDSTDTGAEDVAGTPAATSSSKTMGLQSSSEERESRLLHHSDMSSHEHNNQDFSKILTRQHRHNIESAVEELNSCLPQWNGVKIEHPMDPRIDLSTVGFSIGSLHLAPALTPFLPNDSNINSYNNSIAGGSSNNSVETNQDIAPDHQVQIPFADADADADATVSAGKSISNESPSAAVSSIEQYTKLLEVRTNRVSKMTDSYRNKIVDSLLCFHPHWPHFFNSFHLSIVETKQNKIKIKL